VRSERREEWLLGKRNQATGCRRQASGKTKIREAEHFALMRDGRTIIEHGKSRASAKANRLKPEA
jgi:hypothetical protein